MIRVCLFGSPACGYNVTDWKFEPSKYYDNLLYEDLIERVGQGIILMYFQDKESARDWLLDNEYEYEFIEDDNN